MTILVSGKTGQVATELQAQTEVVALTRIPSTDNPPPAPRPQNSRLECSTTDDLFGIRRLDWRDHLSHVLAQMSTQEQTLISIMNGVSN